MFCILIDIQKTNLNNYSFADIKYFVFVDVSFQRFFFGYVLFQTVKVALAEHGVATHREHSYWIIN